MNLDYKDLIEDYAGLAYRELNSALRKREGIADETTRMKCKNLEESLKTFPRYSNQEVWRWWMDMPNPEEIICWYVKRVNQIIQHPEFLSTSKWKQTNAAYYYLIKTASVSNAIDISGLLMKEKGESEKEVLFIPNSRFKIVDIDEKECIVLLEEVNYDDNNIGLYDQFWRDEPIPHYTIEFNKRNI